MSITPPYGHRDDSPTYQAPTSAAGPLQVKDPTWVTVLATIKNVLAIVTYLAVLYTLWRGWSAIHELSQAWQQLLSSFGD
jgi:hypothetical protein